MPCPLDVKVRPRSEAVTTTTLSAVAPWEGMIRIVTWIKVHHGGVESKTTTWMNRFKVLGSGCGIRWSRCKFTWSKASHNGIRIRCDGGTDVEEFESELKDYLPIWCDQGKKAVWLELDVNEIELSKVAVNHGFEFHHAKYRNVSLVKWLPQDVPNKVPPFGFHQVGVGALCLNSDNEILLVKERHRKVDRYKMPGGLVDPGETLAQGVVREVKEETGVDASFKSILAFWQRTVDENLSDIYMVCRLYVPKDGVSEVIKHDPHEIGECCWMPLSEYMTKAEHPMIRNVIRRAFGEEIPVESPFEPGVELVPTKLQVSPTGRAFESYFCDVRRDR